MLTQIQFLVTRTNRRIGPYTNMAETSNTNQSINLKILEKLNTISKYDFSLSDFSGPNFLVPFLHFQLLVEIFDEGMRQIQG